MTQGGGQAPPERRGSIVIDNMTADEIAEFEEALGLAAQFVTDGVPELEQVHDFDSARAALERVRQLIRSRAPGESERFTISRRRDKALTQLLEASLGIERARSRHREERLRRVSAALATLQDMTAPSQVLEYGARAACELGFHRTLVSSVHESTWLTESSFVPGDAGLAQEILDAGRDNPLRLVSGLPESALVRRRRPIVVDDIAVRERLHDAVVAAARTQSYVAAPVLVRSQVVGFLHSDRYLDKGEVNEFDAELIGAFAHGFGYALERAILVNDLTALRHQMQTLGGQLVGLGNACEERVVPHVDGQPTLHGQRRTPTASATWPVESLTRRETDVVRLMAGGDTNRRIADKLVITEGTVKSHVKRILRKLEATNRAEAVSRWHQLKSR